MAKQNKLIKQARLERLCNKMHSVFNFFFGNYFVEIEKDLYFCSVKN